MSWPTETGRFALGDLTLAYGAVLPGAELSWKTYGTLSAAKDNVVVYPTSYSAQHVDQEWLIAPDMVLDPTRWFIVTPDMFGNGLSSSPSNTPSYPALVTAADNVRAQRRLLPERFGIDQVAAVYGFSMGAQQAYHWAALFPEAVDARHRGVRQRRAPRCTTRCFYCRCWRRWRPRPSTSAAVASRPSPRRACALSPASTPAGQ